MEIDNVKLSWEKILESYISYHEREHPELNVRVQIAPLVEQLNSNRIKSRAIASAGRVVCYAFFLTPESMSDRYYGMVGFIDEESYSEARLQNLLSWLNAEASSAGKILLINEVFNGKDYDRALKEAGFEKLERLKMKLNLPDFAEAEKKDIEGLEISRLDSSDISEMIALHDISFEKSPDLILESTVPVERKKLWIRLFEGKAFGPVIEDGTLWAIAGGRKAGAIITTAQDGEVLIADIFILPEFRNKGLGTFLLSNSMGRLKAAGHKAVILWSTIGNPAIEIYENAGFAPENDREIIYFKRSSAQDSGRPRKEAQ